MKVGSKKKKQFYIILNKINIVKTIINLTF